MKLIKDSIAYVEQKDIFFTKLFPGYVFDEIQFGKLAGGELVIFRRLNSISFWRDNEAVIDFSKVQSLTHEELSSKINELKQKLKFLAEEYLNSSGTYRTKLDRDVERHQEEKSLRYRIHTLQDNQKNPEKYQKLFAAYMN